MREFDLSCELPAPPRQVWNAVLRPATMQAITRGLISFRPINPPVLPETWALGDYRVGLRLFGVLPIGWQVIGVRFPPSDPAIHILQDQGHSPIMRQWDHRIVIAPTPSGTLYTDRVRFDAGWITPFAAVFLRLFFTWRQFRLRRYVARAL